MTVRQLVTSDWPQLRSVRLRALADAPGNFFRTLAEAEAEPDEHWRAMLADPSRGVFGAFDGGRLVGITAAFTDHDDPTGASAMLGMTWLNPAYRGRGVSRTYYEHRIGWARSHGFRRIVVGHRASNVPSGAAMRRAGFVRTGARSHLWPDGLREDEVQYEMLLDD